jgi:hypothetical protein
MWEATPGVRGAEEVDGKAVGESNEKREPTANTKG